MSKSLSGLVHVGLDILASSLNEATNRILVQTGDVVRNTTDSDGVEWWQHVGFVSRPPKPDAGKQAAQGVILKTSGRDVAIASVDQRGLALYGNLRDGETALYAAGADGLGQARVVLKDDGSINIYTTETNTEEGQAVFFRVATDAFEFVAPWGTLKFNATGLHVNTQAGAQFNMGGIYGLPAPLDEIASYVTMQAGTFNVTSSVSSFGIAGQTPLADAYQVMAAIAALQAQLTVMSEAWAALGALSGTVTGAAVAPIAAPVATAAIAGEATITAATTPATSLIPKTTSST
jgi:hypothetical protein